MKNVFTRLAAMMLIIWYSLSVIGFDVHTCTKTGKTFIATVIGGTDCEDIHPEHAAEACSCCSHAHEEDDGEDEKVCDTSTCCIDQWQMIKLTGVRSNVIKDINSNLFSGAYADQPAIFSRNTYSDIITHSLKSFYKPRSGLICSCPSQEVYGVWRI